MSNTDDFRELDPHTIKSTHAQLEDFTQSMIWKDMLSEITRWEEDLVDLYDNAPTWDESLRTQGRREACKYFKQLPHVLLEAVSAAMSIKFTKESEHE